MKFRKPPDDRLDRLILLMEGAVLVELKALSRKANRIMATVADLQAGVDRLEEDAAKVATAVAEGRAALAEITQKLIDLQAAGGILPTDLDPIVAGMNDVDAQLDEAVPDAPAEPPAE